MRFRNSLRLLMNNFKNSYKILLYNLVVILISAAFLGALVYPALKVVLESSQLALFFEDIKGFLQAIVTGNSEFLMEFNNHFLGEGGTVRELLSFMRSKLSFIILGIIALMFIYLLSRFLNTLCYFTVGDILNNKMETYGETRFFNSYIKNLGKASIYSIVYVPIVFLYDLLVLGVCYLFFFYLLSFLNIIFSLFLSVTFVVCMQALKLTWTSMWLPAMVADGESIGKAMSMKNKATKKQRRSMFLTYVTTVYFVIILNVVGAFATVGSALLVTIPASYFLFVCEQFVNYYTVKGKKYFLSYESVVVNPSHGKRTGFFAAMENATIEEFPAKETPSKME